MERVTFLIERSGDQLACLLNPESLVIRRKAGVRARESTSGQLTESGLTDRPLLFTGGGTTEADLKLLFDVSLTGSSITTRNVRDLTGPLWDLAENRNRTEYGRPPLVRFIWGKTFNLPGIVVGVAERLERFTGEGIPTRSWMRMRFVRVDEDALDRRRPSSAPSSTSLRETAAEASSGEGDVHAVTGGVQESSGGEGAGASITTTSDILNAAFTNTRAVGLLTSAETAISGAVDTLSEGASRVSAVEDDPTAEEQLAAAADTFDRALDAAAQGIRNGDVNAVGAAVEQMFSAAGSAATATASLISDTGRAVAEEINRALDGVGPAAEKLLTAAQTVVREVVQTSARVIAAAVTNTDRMIVRVSATAENIASAASTTVRRASTALQSGLETVTDALDRIRTAGELAALDLLPDAFHQISRATDRLWSAGEGAAAEQVVSAIEEMAVRLKNMKAAAEAIGSVTQHPLSSFLLSTTDTLRSTVAAARETEDLSRLHHISAYLQTVDRSLPSTRPDGQADPNEQAREVIQSVESAIEEVLESGDVERLDDISDLLPAVEEAAQALKAVEEDRAAEAITTAVRVRAEMPSAESGAERHQGERLDQIAFNSYGSPAYWRLLALHNNIDHPLRLPVGLQLSVPPATRTSGS